MLIGQPVGKSNANERSIATQFGDTLPRGSGQSGDAVGPADTQRLAESASFNKPLRRAQIFDKGVDASMMQVLVPCSVSSSTTITLRSQQSVLCCCCSNTRLVLALHYTPCTSIYQTRVMLGTCCSEACDVFLVPRKLLETDVGFINLETKPGRTTLCWCLPRVPFRCSPTLYSHALPLSEEFAFRCGAAS